MVPMARILVVGVVFIAAPWAFAELKPTRQPTSANAAAETNFMLSPLCVSLRRPGEPVGRASPARQPDSNDNGRRCLQRDRAQTSAVVGCAPRGPCSAKRLFHLRPQIDLVLSAAKSALGTTRTNRAAL